MENEKIIFSKKNNIAIIMLNNEQKMNAVCENMLEQIAQAITICENDDDIKVIIIKGGEKCFAMGIDTNELIIEKKRRDEVIEEMQNNFRKIEKSAKPIIAMVNGFAIGAGLEIALACDFIIAADNAKFALPEISLGMTTSFGGAQRILRTIGKAKTMEMMMTGKIMNAEEAEKAGVVARIVPETIIFEEVIKTADKIAKQPEKTIALIRDNIRNGLTNLDETIEYEKKNAKLALWGEDFAEAIAKIA